MPLRQDRDADNVNDELPLRNLNDFLQSGPSAPVIVQQRACHESFLRKSKCAISTGFWASVFAQQRACKQPCLRSATMSLQGCQHKQDQCHLSLHNDLLLRDDLAEAALAATLMYSGTSPPPCFRSGSQAIRGRLEGRTLAISRKSTPSADGSGPS